MYSFKRLFLFATSVLFLCMFTQFSYSQLQYQWEEIYTNNNDPFNNAYMHKTETAVPISAADHNHYVMITRSDTYPPIFGLVKTTDGGSTWKDLQLDFELEEEGWEIIYQYVVHPDPSTIIVTGEGNWTSDTLMASFRFMAVSNDAGTTWNIQYFIEKSSCLSMLNSRAGAMLMEGEHEEYQYILTTNDCWKNTSVKNLPDSLRISYMDYVDSTTIIVRGMEPRVENELPKFSLYKTTDLAKSWTKVYNNINSEFTFHFSDSLNGWGNAFKNDNFKSIVAKTDDGGKTWHPFDSLHSYYYFFYSDPDSVIFSGDFNDIKRTTDGGNTWMHEYTPVTSNPELRGRTFAALYLGNGTALALSDRSVLYKLTDRKILASTSVIVPGDYLHPLHNVPAYLTPVPGAENYRLQMFGRDSSVSLADVFRNKKQYIVLDTIISDTIIYFNNLNYNTEYSVWAKAINSQYQSDWCGIERFNTKKWPGFIEPPKMLHPKEGIGELVSVDSFNLVWTNVDDIAKYEVRVLYSSNNETDTIRASTSDTTYLLRDLQPSKFYLCQVRAFSDAYSSDWSEKAILMTDDELGIEAIGMQDKEQLIYPNPVRDRCIIKNIFFNSPGISVYNSLGIECISLTGTQTAISEYIEIDLSSLPNGRYFLTISDGKKTLYREFVVAR